MKKGNQDYADHLIEHIQNWNNLTNNIEEKKRRKSTSANIILGVKEDNNEDKDMQFGEDE